MIVKISVPRGPLALTSVELGTSELERLIVERLEKGRAALPLPTDFVQPALELARDTSTNLHQLAECVGKVPPLAARLLSARNPTHEQRPPSRSLYNAMARLGLSSTKDIILQAAHSAPRLQHFGTEIERSYQRAAASAALCRVIAAELGVECHHAYLCGLLHDIGEARVYKLLDEISTLRGSVPPPEEAEQLVARYHGRAGAELAQRWELPSPIVEVCKRHHDKRPPSSAELRVVRIADLLTAAVDLEFEGKTWILDPEVLAPLELERSDARVIVTKAAESRRRTEKSALAPRLGL